MAVNLPVAGETPWDVKLNAAISGIDTDLQGYKAEKGAANGYAALDGTGKVPSEQLPAGLEGPQGPPGTAYLNAQWNFNQNTAVSPANGTMRMNGTTYAATTTLWVSETDRDGLDRVAGLDVAVPGDQIIMQSAQGRAVWTITGHADSGVYRTFTVTLVESSGNRPSASSPTTLYFATVGGTSGKILSGTATPTSGDGAIGDYYLDTDDLILYGPKGMVPSAGEYVTNLPGSYTNGPGTLGMRYRFLAAGQVNGIRFWVGPSATLTAAAWEVYLFSNAGTMLASKDAPTLTANAWNEVTFTTPVPVATGTTYVAAVFCPAGAGNWAYRASGFAGIITGNVNALADNVDGRVGVYHMNRDTFPVTNDGGTTYGISPLFTTGGLVPSWPVALKSPPPGGTTGQVLKKLSGTDYDWGWVT